MTVAALMNPERYVQWQQQDTKLDQTTIRAVEIENLRPLLSDLFDLLIHMSQIWEGTDGAQRELWNIVIPSKVLADTLVSNLTNTVRSRSDVCPHVWIQMETLLYGAPEIPVPYIQEQVVKWQAKKRSLALVTHIPAQIQLPDLGIVEPSYVVVR